MEGNDDRGSVRRSDRNHAIRKKIVEVEQLLPKLDRLRQRGQRIVQCHGCFDVVHPGHIRHLQDAAGLGEVLVVSVTADAQVDKGIGRPLIPHELRCENLAALSMVDFVVVDSESWAGPLLERIRPDVYVKGLEYSTNNDPRFLREKALVEGYGGLVVFTSGEVVYSSTLLQKDQIGDRGLQLQRLRSLALRYGLCRETLIQRLARLRELRLVVVGDAILDHYVECEAGSVSAEAPVLQVTPIDEKYYVGGAGVLALHAAQLGASVTFVGYLNRRDPAVERSWIARLEQANVRARFVETDGLLLKTRYLVEGQKVFKVDRCRPLVISTGQQARWTRHLDAALAEGADGLLAVDFGFGSLSRSALSAGAMLARQRGARLFGDTSSNRYCTLGKFAGLRFDVLYPNESEVRGYLGEPEVGLPVLVSRLFEQELTAVVVLTLGPRGLVLFDRDHCMVEAGSVVRYLPEYLPSLARFAFDSLGAGDALSTAASLVRLAGGSHVEAALLGSVAAAIVVQRLGNDPVTLEEIYHVLKTHPLFAD